MAQKELVSIEITREEIRLNTFKDALVILSPVIENLGACSVLLKEQLLTLALKRERAYT